MIISDLNYVETVSTEEIEGGAYNYASYGSVIAKEIKASLSQNANSSAVAFGGVNGSAILYSKVGTVNAPTYATSSATNNGSVYVSA